MSELYLENLLNIVIIVGRLKMEPPDLHKLFVNNYGSEAFPYSELQQKIS